MWKRQRMPTTGQRRAVRFRDPLANKTVMECRVCPLPCNTHAPVDALYEVDERQGFCPGGTFLNEMSLLIARCCLILSMRLLVDGAPEFFRFLVQVLTPGSVDFFGQQVANTGVYLVAIRPG